MQTSFEIFIEYWHFECFGAKKHEATGQTVTMDKFVLKRKTAISAADKTKLIDAGVNLVSKDLRPFAFVEGEGMIDLARTLWNLGAIYGSVSNEEMIDIMPCTRAISKNVRIKAKDKKNEMHTLLLRAVEKCPFIAVTCDKTITKGFLISVSQHTFMMMI